MGSDSRIRSILNCERGMRPISGIVNSISELIGQLTLPAREKKELETGLLKLIQELERELAQARAVTVQAAGDVDICQCYFDRDFYQFTDSG